MCLDVRKKENKKMWALYISFVWFVKGREKENIYFYLFALINDREIYILKHL